MRQVKSSYTVSIHYDRRLYKHDIAASTVHVRMLARQGIITHKECEVIIEGLDEVLEEIDSGSFPWREELEDIHMNVEHRLYDKIGEVAGKLHTARSRNDQVAVDMRMYTKDVSTQIIQAVHDLRSAIVHQAEENLDVVMPGYTHMQKAQPVLFAHHMLAYYEMLSRDSRRFESVRVGADVMPLGSGALGGVTYPIDRDFMAQELQFSKVSANSMDVVSDRDFLVEFQSAASICMVHLSRLAEELIIWSSEEFAFVRLDDAYTTSSSMMPQKRNPDFAELARGKTGRVIGGLVALLTVLKGLPLTYNRDLQEDKEGFFDSVDTLLSTLEAFKGMVSTMNVNVDRMAGAIESGYVLATDIADYLVSKGMTFRESYNVVAQLTEYAAREGKQFHEIALDTYKNSFSDHFDEDVYSITALSSVKSRDVYGGTSPDAVKAAVIHAKYTLRSGNG